MLRLFVGIFIPENLKQKIIYLQNEIGKLPIKCKFVEPENLHVSLSFLGNIEESKLELIKSKLDFVAQTYTKFKAKISGLKLIPSERYVRVIALNIQNGTLSKISTHVAKEIGGDVNPPHVTLCRVKSVSDHSFVKKILELNSNSEVGEFLIDSIDLIESSLKQTGPVYKTLHKSFLLNQ